MKGMTLIVQQVTRLVAGLILLYSFYLILFGHLSPGGGFAGGVVMACGFILMILAFGKAKVNTMIQDSAATIWDCVGAMAFLLLALWGLAKCGVFFENTLAKPGDFKLISGGIIPLANIAIGLKVGACMVGAFVALTVFRSKDENDQIKGDQL